MTSVNFLADEKNLYGFEIGGHSSVDCDDFEGKIVCAAVSSAAYMAANTIIEVIGDKAFVEVSDAKMILRCKNASQSSISVLEGLKLHLTSLADEYSNNIKIYGGAKNVKD